MPPGVRAAIAVEDALVILRGGERDDALAVADDVEARLLAGEELLDHDRLRPRRRRRARASRRATAASASSVDDATTTPLPAASPSVFTTSGRRGRAHVALGRVGVVEDLEGRRRDAVALQEAAS